MKHFMLSTVICITCVSPFFLTSAPFANMAPTGLRMYAKALEPQSYPNQKYMDDWRLSNTQLCTQTQDRYDNPSCHLLNP
jgi:hypothetical protein